jgi:hypothetical protein
MDDFSVNNEIIHRFSDSLGKLHLVKPASQYDAAPMAPNAAQMAPTAAQRTPNAAQMVPIGAPMAPTPTIKFNTCNLLKKTPLYEVV